jgi:hypothetical protein
MKHAVAALLLSATLQFLCFLRWPGDPDWDVAHSVFAAQNFLAHRGLKSINLFAAPTDDLARQARIYWMTHWPPAHSLLYLGAMEFGLTPGPATKVLIFLCLVGGGLGWLLLARELNTPSSAILVIAVAWPWLAFMAHSWLDYKNDTLACALAPWIYWAVIRIEPLRSPEEERWLRLIGAALLAGFAIWVKFSMSPIIAGSGLYLLLLDGTNFSRRRIARIAVFGTALAAPAILLWSLNHAWAGETSYPLLGGGLPFSLFVFGKNIISHTFGSAMGWELVVIESDAAAGHWLHHHFPHGVVFVVSLIAMVIWVIYLVRQQRDEKDSRFLRYLVLLTLSLLGTLAATTVLSKIHYDFSADGRFSFPISYGWLLLGVIALAKISERSTLRSAALITLTAPVVFSVLFFAASGLFTRPYLQMPHSRTIWFETPDPAHAAFFSTLTALKPDLIVTHTGRDLMEFEVPDFYTFEATKDDANLYYSSKALRVIALVSSEQEATVLLRKFRQASTISRVQTPDGFPYLVFELDFAGPEDENGDHAATPVPMVPRPSD